MTCESAWWKGEPRCCSTCRRRSASRLFQRLERLGVRVYAGSMVERVTAEAVILADGTHVPSTVLVWAGGAKADPHASLWGFRLSSSGRLLTTADLKAEGFETAYALGDVAEFRDQANNRVLPMLAQFAIREAQHTAQNILRELADEPTTPYSPHMHGEFVSIGPSWGVGWAWRLQLSGIPAIVMKRLTYVLYWWQVGGVRLAWRRGRELLAMQR